MARKKKTDNRWRIDWAGPHGTAWGSINGALTVAATAAVLRATTTTGPLPGWAAGAIGAALTLTAIIGSLLRAALPHKHQPAMTTLYKLACYTGAGVLIWVAVTRPAPWTALTVTAWSSALIVATVVAGLAATLATPDPAAVAAMVAAAAHPDAAGQVARDQLRDWWENRMGGVLGAPVTVAGIETWTETDAAGKPVGYTVELRLSEDKGWADVTDAILTKIENVLDLPIGGGITKQPQAPGAPRRRVLLDVLCADALGADIPYQPPTAATSINDNLHGVWITRDWQRTGPNLRQRCMVLVGETGSGKTNAARVIQLAVANCDDAIQWGLDHTGGGLFSALQTAWLTGRASRPAIDWPCMDLIEGYLMARAARRVGHSRKTSCTDLMAAVDDDKVPVSGDVPEIVVAADEIASYLGMPARETTIPVGAELHQLGEEGRASAIRLLLFALRGTDAMLNSNTQALCHIRGILKCQSDAEIAYTLGWHSGITTTDLPHPGCSGVIPESGTRPMVIKYPRVLPSHIATVVTAIAARRDTTGTWPHLTGACRLAANGRHPDGTPMQGLLDGELDCYDTRWSRIARNHPGKVVPGYRDPGPSATLDTTPTPNPSPTPAPADNDQAPTVEPAATIDDATAALADNAATLATLADLPATAAREATAAAVDEAFAAITAAGIDRLPETNWWDIAWQALRAAGPDGADLPTIRNAIAAAGHNVPHRDTIHTRLKNWRDDGHVHQPQGPRGPWAIRPLD